MDVVSGLRVLVVDDNPEMLQSLTHGLMQQSVAVDACSNTSQALLRLEPGRYDAVIADQVLNCALCGHEFLLAAQQVDPQAVTILMATEDLSHCGLAGDRFDATISKPVVPVDLIERIGRLRLTTRVAERNSPRDTTHASPRASAA